MKLRLPPIRRISACALAAAVALLGASVASCKGDSTAPNPALEVASISIDQGSFAIERGFHQALTATVKNKAGETITIPVVWRSTVETVATLDANGRLAALDTGTTTVFAATLGVASQPIGVRVVWQGAAKVATYQFTAPNAASPGVTIKDSVKAQVTDRAGNPVSGARVAFTTTTGGGTISPAIVKTNSQGVAAAQWKLGNSFGANTVTAAVLDDDDKPLPFVVTKDASFVIITFQAIAPVQGDAQTGQILSRLPVAPSVRVVDTAGKPRPGVPVTFTATAGGRVTTSTVSTGADGVASPGTWTLGDVTGDQTLIVRVESAELLLHATATGTAIHFLPAQVAAGGFATCAILAEGTVNCWGEQPKVGDGTSTNRSAPTPTSGGVQFSWLAGSPTHFCGVATDQSIYCWGVNALADTSGRTALATIPTRLGSSLSWSQVAPGFAFNCAMASDQSVYCWGDNSDGQLGDGTLVRRFVPATISGGFRFTALASGSYHACGLSADGSAFCWGLNANGQLGDGTTTRRLTPTAVGGALKFQALGAGESWTCGLNTLGRAYCWGNVSSTAQTQTTPLTYTAAPVFTSLSVGGAHACALTADGTAYCWGNNNYGQLGDSSTTSRPDPTPVSGGVKFKSISAGYAHTCARASDGSLMCWGLNRAGELGDSTSANRIVPRYLVLGVAP